jgi:asparagine synthase (glutamine-hydrolysing)
VNRWLAGIFDWSARADTSRLARTLAPHASTVVEQGPLQVAYSGPVSALQTPLCLLDGHLHNASELSAALDAPAACSEEQLLAAGWQRWGRDLPSHMRGDFVVLVWDPARGEGILARDQLGARSMYLHDVSGELRFACEIRHLLALLPRRPAPDPVSVAHWLTMSNRPGSATLYSGIRRLNPGAALLLDRNGAREERYWAPRFQEPLAGTASQLAQRLRAGLDLAVERRLDPDAPTGVLMSGGLDSASVAAVAASQAPGRIRAYSAVFPDHPGVDESALIQELRVALDLPGINAAVRPGGLLASALEAIAAWELPIRSWGDFWGLPLLRAAAAAGTRVMLGGDGGDELFGPRSYVLADRLRAGHPLQAARLVRRLPGAAYGPGRRELLRMVGSMAVIGALPYGLHEPLRRSTAGRGSPAWLRRAAVRDLRASEDPLAWKRLDGPRWWAELAHGLTRGIEENGTFEHQRRRAASAGLEARHPLFDLDLMELCLRQPPLATLDPHRSRPTLRAAMADLLPDTVRMRPQKALFDSVLVDSLAEADGTATRRLLTNPKAELAAYADLEQLARTLLDDDRQRRSQPFRWMWQVWRLSTAECWLRAQADPGLPALSAELLPSAAQVDLQPATGSPSEAASSVFPP